ncbi:MAG: hypothetical protein HC867_08705 [Bacteroidia bacterium]|nr:hypothetical protein [Bacteroidia bacterium]
MQKLISNTDNLKADISKFELTVNGLSKDLQLKTDSVTKKEGEIERLNFTVNDLNTKVSNFNAELSAAKENIKGQEGQVNQLNSDNLLLTEKTTFSYYSENKRLTETSGTNSQTITDLTNRKSELDIELAEIKKDLQNIQTELGEVKKQNTQLIKDEDFRKQEHSNSLASLEKIQNQIQAERNKEVEERNTKEIERIRKLKETWSKHQENAKSIIKSICQKHTIQYIDKVSFKGDPDNSLLICDEYIVFDAKSPGSDDLTNFPNYLKDQAEKAKSMQSKNQ